MNKVERNHKVIMRENQSFTFKEGDGIDLHINEMKERHTYQDLLFYLKNISGILNSNYKYKELDSFLEDMTELGIYDEELD